MEEALTALRPELDAFEVDDLDDNWGTALAVLTELGPATQPLVPLLREWLHQGRPEVVGSLAPVLRAILGQEAVALIGSLLRDDSTLVRREAAIQLGSWGDFAITSVAELARGASDDSDIVVRQRCLIALVQVAGAAPEVMALLERLLADAQPQLRAVGAAILVCLGATAGPALDVLQQALDPANPELCRAALTALVRFAGPHVAFLLGRLLPLLWAGPATSASALRVREDLPVAVHTILVRIGAAAVEPLMGVLQTAERNSRAAFYAALALERMGPAARPAIPALVRCIEAAVGNAPVDAPASAVQDVVRQPIRALAALVGPEDDKAVPSLASALRWVERDLCHAVLDGLARMGPSARAAVPALQELIASGRFPDLSSAAVTALARINPR
jgi:HEAT repeat protein